MRAYILRRLALVLPTLWGILTLNFFIVQAAPGGPVEQMMARLQGLDVEATARIGGSGGETSGPSDYRGARGLDPALVKRIEKMYGFDRSV